MRRASASIRYAPLCGISLTVMSRWAISFSPASLAWAAGNSAQHHEITSNPRLGRGGSQLHLNGAPDHKSDAVAGLQQGLLIRILVGGRRPIPEDGLQFCIFGSDYVIARSNQRFYCEPVGLLATLN